MSTPVAGSEASPRSSFAATVSGAFQNLTRSRSKDSRTTTTTTTTQQDRSRSRGRDPLISTGRGGAGNILASPERTGPDNAELDTIERAKERSQSRVRSSGRGGAGNMAIPENEVHVTNSELAKEQEIMRQHAKEKATQIHSSGRGGAGNIVSSRSPSREPDGRSRSRGRISEWFHGGHHHGGEHAEREGRSLSASRGAGVGTVQSLDAAAEELDKPAHHEPAKVFSTGRGGGGNIVHGGATEAPIEPAVHSTAGVTSSGRGGAGNMVL